MSVFRFPDQVHFRWDQRLAPPLKISPGDSVLYDLRDVTDGQITPRSTSVALTSLDPERIYPLAGPLAIRGAEPGDTLEVEVVDLTPHHWGWTGIIPGDGLLAEDFHDPHLHLWDIGTSRFVRFHDLATIPLRPFCGTMGVSPMGENPQLISPPGHFGGNIDCRDLVVGSRLYLPVQVPEALFSVGDPHAAQGDGEVCVSALECPMSAELRFRLHKDRTISAPEFQTIGEPHTDPAHGGYYGTTGIGPDLMQAAKDALRAMVDHIVRTYRLDPKDAYVLASVVVDLRISEVVNYPNWVVSAYLPLGIFMGQHLYF